MRINWLIVVAALTLAACGGKSPTAPAPAAPPPTVDAVTVTPANPGQTIFIGQPAQFRATATLSNGQMQSASGIWGSDNPAVATVDQNGMVAPVAAGEATIFVDVNPRGSVLIRVFPSFGGTWTGNEVAVGCQDTGRLEGACRDRDFFTVGEVFRHSSRFMQTADAVDAAIDAGAGVVARMTGTVAVGGELQLPSAPFLPADPDFHVQAQVWRSRSDVPSVMTGTYDVVFTLPGVSGSATLNLRLEDVLRTSTTAVPLSGAAVSERIYERLRRYSPQLTE
jgi:hypothetical protein